MKLVTNKKTTILYVGSTDDKFYILACVCEDKREYFRIHGNMTRVNVTSNSDIAHNTKLAHCHAVVIEKADTFLDIDTDVYGTQIHLHESPFRLEA